MQKKIYQFNSLDFLNATVDEIYYRKKHYVQGKDLLLLKGVLSNFFVQIERTFRCVYCSNISLDTQRIDLELFRRQFPFIYDTFYGAMYGVNSENGKEMKVNGIIYYTNILEQLRNINLHAVISTDLEKIFKVDEEFINKIPKFAEGLFYCKNGVLTIAGMLGLLLPILHEKYAKYLFRYIFQQWSDVLCGLSFKDSWSYQEQKWNDLSAVYRTNYEVEIREYKDSGDLFDAIFGRENNYVQKEERKDGTYFLWDISKETNSPKLSVSGTLTSANNIITLCITKGSNVGSYFEEDYTLKICDTELFLSLCRTVPPFMAVAYLHKRKINVFNKTIYENIDQFLFKKLNNPKFYVDKNLTILCYGDKNADIREINKTVSGNLLKLFLDFEEAVVFRNDIAVYGTYSRFIDITKKLNVPQELTNKLLACRNFCSHVGMLNEFHYCTLTEGYNISLDFIFETIDAFIEFLKSMGENEHAHWLQKDLEEYILNHLVGLKYKRIFETSIKLFRSNSDWIVKNSVAIKKSLGAIYNSCIDAMSEEVLIKKMKRNFYFFISPSLWDMKDHTFKFKELILYRILDNEVELCGTKTGVDVLEFLGTPATNLSKLTKNGKKVQLDLVDEKREGILLVRSYKAISY